MLHMFRNSAWWPWWCIPHKPLVRWTPGVHPAVTWLPSEMRVGVCTQDLIKCSLKIICSVGKEHVLGVLWWWPDLYDHQLYSETNDIFFNCKKLLISKGWTKQIEQNRIIKNNKWETTAVLFVFVSSFLGLFLCIVSLYFFCIRVFCIRFAVFFLYHCFTVLAF